MAGEWTTKKIGDCGKVITGKTPSTRVAEYFGGEYPFITIPDLDGRRDISTTIRSLSQRGADALHTCQLPAGAVMMSCIATIGKCGLTVRPSFTNQQINSVICNSGVLAKYLYYVFKTLAPTLESVGGGGSVYTNVSKSRFADITVHLPPLKEQQAIAHILGTLDDKIELNRRMNRTLEEMARAIFKSWFVDFDPVRAKADGRNTGLPAEIAALFPDSFEDSELGEIPKGWGISPIGDVVQVVGGGTPSTREPAYWDGGTHPFCTPKDMSQLTNVVLLETERHLTDEGMAKVSSGQLPVGTVLLSSRAPIGYLAIAETPVSVNQGIIAMVCDSTLPNLYVLYWTQANMDRVLANANGSTFMEISKRNFRPITAVVPSRPMLRCFMQIVEPMHQRVVSSLKQIQQLSDLRDSLLPRLISGELVVANAERIARRTV